MSSDTVETPINHTEMDERRTFHVKMRPSKAQRLAMYARTEGLTIGGAFEKAVDLLVRTHEHKAQGEKP